MKRFLIFSLALICAGAFSLKSAQSAVPQLINYQGILTDAAGDPVVNDAYQVKFIIWDASAAAADLWNSGFQTVNTVDGLFEYILARMSLCQTIFLKTLSDIWESPLIPMRKSARALGLFRQATRTMH
ncbi:MAG: hypothetical protein IIB00_09375 [candidate division Zixibacteria bacterium]|nr:hypothetical protein [candidate division Zixibacteria bacterium]